jgi:hypothetical protein
LGRAPTTCVGSKQRTSSGSRNRPASRSRSSRSIPLRRHQDERRPFAYRTVPSRSWIDQARGRAYTHEWEARTLAFDVRTHAQVGSWLNGCAASRGIDLEPKHGWVLAACNEGTLTVLDAATDGHVVDALSAGAGYDVIGYARTKRHVYLAGSSCGCLSILGLSPSGKLSFLDRLDAPSDTHCVVADDSGHAFVCAPSEGALYRITDPHP